MRILGFLAKIVNGYLKSFESHMQKANKTMVTNLISTDEIKEDFFSLKMRETLVYDKISYYVIEIALVLFLTFLSICSIYQLAKRSS